MDDEQGYPYDFGNPHIITNHYSPSLTIINHHISSISMGFFPYKPTILWLPPWLWKHPKIQKIQSDQGAAAHLLGKVFLSHGASGRSRLVFEKDATQHLKKTWKKSIPKKKIKTKQTT